MIFQDALKRYLAPLEKRVLGYLARALITKVIENNPMQLVQIDLGNGEIKNNVERVQNFGFTSFPKVGAQVIVLFHGGNRDHPLAITVDDGNYRPQLNEGESAQYNTNGNAIRLRISGNTEIDVDSVANPLSGVLTGECIDSLTGVLYADKSLKVFARKT